MGCSPHWNGLARRWFRSLCPAHFGWPRFFRRSGRLLLALSLSLAWRLGDSAAAARARPQIMMSVMTCWILFKHPFRLTVASPLGLGLCHERRHSALHRLRGAGRRGRTKGGTVIDYRCLDCRGRRGGRHCHHRRGGLRGDRRHGGCSCGCRREPGYALLLFQWVQAVPLATHKTHTQRAKRSTSRSAINLQRPRHITSEGTCLPATVSSPSCLARHSSKARPCLQAPAGSRSPWGQLHLRKL